MYFLRVWKGILGIRDLTKIRCGIRENEKYLDGIRDLTATREAGFAKILGREAGFCCLSVGNLGNHRDPNKHYDGKSKSTRQGQNINRKGQLLQKLVFFHAFLGKKNEIQDSDEKSAGCGILVKKERECGIRTPLPDPVFSCILPVVRL